MRVLALEATNFAKLKVISIRPVGALVPICGKNRNGKTSALNSIWVAIAGAAVAPAEPIRHGEERARIRVELGDTSPEIIVTRTFTRRDDGEITTALKVEKGTGGRFDKPQEVLNSLFGRFTFEPTAFEDLRDDERLAAIRPLADGVDFDALTQANKDDFAKRTDVNRRAADLRAQAQGVPVPAGPVPAPVDITALQEEYEGAAAFNADAAEKVAGRKRAAEVIESLEAEETDLRAKLDALIARRENLQTRLAETPMPPEPKDLLKLREELRAGQGKNEHAAAAKRRAELDVAAGDAEQEAANLTKAITARKLQMAQAVAAAVSKVPGLGFEPDEDDAKAGGRITLGGVPFNQASDAEQLEASVQIAALLNPTLRIVRIRNGNRLDDDAMAALAVTLEKLDMQAWVEVVSSDKGVGFYLEDGELAGPGTAPTPRRVDAPADEPLDDGEAI